jgi:hypothetical protein
VSGHRGRSDIRVGPEKNSERNEITTMKDYSLNQLKNLVIDWKKIEN